MADERSPRFEQPHKLIAAAMLPWIVSIVAGCMSAEESRTGSSASGGAGMVMSTGEYALRIDPPIVVAEIEAGRDLPLDAQAIERFLRRLSTEYNGPGALKSPASPQIPGRVYLLHWNTAWGCDLELLPSKTVQGTSVRICVRFASPIDSNSQIYLYSPANFVSAWGAVDDNIKKAVLRHASELSPNVLTYPIQQ